MINKVDGNIPEHIRIFSEELVRRLDNFPSGSIAGAYIHGSLTYGGYIRERSDVDILIIVNDTFLEESIRGLSDILKDLSKQYPQETKNTELDVINEREVSSLSPTITSVAKFAGGNFSEKSEKIDGFWIELANVRMNGIVLAGSNPQNIIPEIGKDFLIRANREKFESLRSTAEKWEKIDLWNQTYILVQSSRVLYSLFNDLQLTSKQNALAWAVENAPERFKEMLQVASEKLDNWRGPREQVISDNYLEYLEYIESELQKREQV